MKSAKIFSRMNMKNVWKTLPKPFFVQAPMEDVTDTVFRQIIASVGKPDLFFTEFTNADGIIKGGSKYIENCLKVTKTEHPIIAQIWGNTPEHYLDASKIISKLDFDGIDINMGCPVRKVVKNGFCSGLIKNPSLAKELYLAAFEGASGLPVSIKTRIGYGQIATEEWIGFLLELKPAAITVHARTAAEMSKVPVHTGEFEKAVALRNKISPETIIVANGDIENREQGLQIVKKYGVDGVMIGRGLLHNPWVFNPDIKIEEISVKGRLELLEKHIKLFDKTWGKEKNFDIMKKFYKAYLHGFDNAAELRLSLMQYHTAEETLSKINELISNPYIALQSPIPLLPPEF